MIYNLLYCPCLIRDIAICRSINSWQKRIETLQSTLKTISFEIKNLPILATIDHLIDKQNVHIHTRFETERSLQTKCRQLFLALEMLFKYFKNNVPALRALLINYGRSYIMQYVDTNVISVSLV